jgi:hypothetical protein
MIKNQSQFADTSLAPLYSTDNIIRSRSTELSQTALIDSKTRQGE